MGGAYRGTLRGCLCFHFIPEEEGDRGPLPQPATTPGPLKPPPQLQPPMLQLQLEPGSHSGPLASTMPFVYGSDVRRRSLRLLAGSLASSCSTCTAPVSGPGTALLPLSCIHCKFDGHGKEDPEVGFYLGLSGPEAGRVRRGGGGKNRKCSTFSGSCPVPSVSVISYALQFPACCSSKRGGGTRASP